MNQRIKNNLLAAKVILFLAISLLTTLGQPATLLALSDAQRKLYNSNINYFDAEVGSATTCAGTPAPPAPGGNPAPAGSFTLDQVKTFASEPITSTWNISDSTAEQWFLQQSGARATITKYGLTSGNIGAITAAVKAAGVSPVFFYLYAVNEGGGAGGFINHYGSDVAGGGVANATHDAQYIVTQAQETGGRPATGGGEPADMPFEDAQNILNALPAGSIGVVYIQATAAVTAELEDLSGKIGGWSGLFNTPLSDSMLNITRMGGDPSQGGSTVSTGDCPTIGVTGEGIAKAISWAVMMANNDGYGYDQTTPGDGRGSGWIRWQSDPSCTHQCGSFDCSSFVAAALTEAGYFSTNPNFATGTEASELTGAGFRQVATSAPTSAGLLPGDVLLADSHTSLYIGNNQMVDARINENGVVNGGQVGDQNHQEIEVHAFNDHPWIGVFRAQN